MSAPRPVVLALHGGGGDGPQMERLSGLRAVADDAGFLLVYPDGVEGNWNDGRPEVGATADDVQFVRDLLDELATLYAVDPARIYATGMSNGGHMCFRLAYELSDRIAAIAPVAALLSAPLGRTRPPRAVPAFVIAGDADPICPNDGGQVGGGLTDRGVVLSAAETERLWTRTWGELPPPLRDDLADLAPDDGTRAERVSYALPADPATPVFVLVTVRGGGHTWPGGDQYLATAVVGPTARDFSASRLVWQFFQRHTLP
ncbi:MAG: PHB depolymerase family esterase [Phycisphaerae bacterium]